MARIFKSMVVMATGALADGKCTEAESLIWTDSQTFSNDLQTCAIETMGVASTTASCLVGKVGGISLGCASCFGTIVQCGRDKCMAPCVHDSGAPGCVACVAEKGCNDDLATCTGFAQGPPNPIPKMASETTTTTKSSVYGFASLVGVVSVIFIALM